MMGYGGMMGYKALGGGGLFFGWVVYALVVVVLVLGIIALWKYITKN